MKACVAYTWMHTCLFKKGTVSLIGVLSRSSIPFWNYFNSFYRKDCAILLMWINSATDYVLLGLFPGKKPMAFSL